MMILFSCIGLRNAQAAQGCLMVTGSDHKALRLVIQAPADRVGRHLRAFAAGVQPLPFARSHLSRPGRSVDS